MSPAMAAAAAVTGRIVDARQLELLHACLLYTSDAADERSSVDLGGRRIIKKKNTNNQTAVPAITKLPLRARLQSDSQQIKHTQKS